MEKHVYHQTKTKANDSLYTTLTIYYFKSVKCTKMNWLYYWDICLTPIKEKAGEKLNISNSTFP